MSNTDHSWREENEVVSHMKSVRTIVVPSAVYSDVVVLVRDVVDLG